MDLKYALLFALLFVPLVAAVPAGQGAGLGKGQLANGEGLDAAMDLVNCKTDFTVAVMESMIDRVPEASSLDDNVDALQADTEELQNYADADDVLGFRSYLRGTYEPNLREAKQEVLQLRRTANIRSETLSDLRSDYESLRADFDGCHVTGLKRAAEAKLTAYDRFLDKAEEKADNLDAKGVDTAGLEDLISDARAEIVEPLQDAVDSADDSSEVRDALKQYCLFNGCPNGVNFHFAARFELEKLNQILDKVEQNATDAGLGDEVSDIQEDLDDAEESLGDAGTSQYNDEEYEGMWNSLHSASSKTRDLLAELRSS